MSLLKLLSRFQSNQSQVHEQTTVKIHEQTRVLAVFFCSALRSGQVQERFWHFQVRAARESQLRIYQYCGCRHVETRETNQENISHLDCSRYSYEQQPTHKQTLFHAVFLRSAPRSAKCTNAFGTSKRELIQKDYYGSVRVIVDDVMSIQE